MSKVFAIAFGLFQIYSTQQSIGFEWEVTGDDNHNAITSIHYRTAWGEWEKGIRPGRVDYRCYWGRGECDSSRVNMIAGSLMFLEPATDYQVRIEVNDPDGGSYSKTEIIRTKAMPVRPVNIIELNPGHYDLIYLDQSNTAYMGSEGVTIDQIIVKADSVWIEGFELISSESRHKGYGISTGNQGSPFIGGDTIVYTNVTVTNNTFLNYNYAIVVGGPGWYISNNTIEGKPAKFKEPPGYFGVNCYMWHTTVVAENEIYNVQDAIQIHYGNVSWKARNIDIHSNYIHDTADDGLELDGGWSNVRAWNNTIINPGMHGISFQPQKAGPWYLIGNYIEGFEYSGALKLAAVDQFVFINNTCIQHGKTNKNLLDVAVIRGAHEMVKAYSRNNKYIFQGTKRGKNLDSYVWHSSVLEKSKVWPADWRTYQNGDQFISPPGIKDKSWQQ